MAQEQRYPLNAVGDFYVANGMCIACTAPEHEAADLITHDPAAFAGYHCYFTRQPATPEELERAIRAVRELLRGRAIWGHRPSRDSSACTTRMRRGVRFPSQRHVNCTEQRSKVEASRIRPGE